MGSKSAFGDHTFRLRKVGHHTLTVFKRLRGKTFSLNCRSKVAYRQTLSMAD